MSAIPCPTRQDFERVTGAVESIADSPHRIAIALEAPAHQVAADTAMRELIASIEDNCLRDDVIISLPIRKTIPDGGDAA